MKKTFLLFVVFCLLISAMAVSADNCAKCDPCAEEAVEEEVACDPCAEEEVVEEEVACGPFTVTYEANNCLAKVPVDCCEYENGEEVTVKFEPVEYKDGLIFYGWDWNDDGVADFGYNYNTFTMGDKDVTLKAICIPMYSAPATCKGCHLHGRPVHPWGPRPFGFGRR